MNIISLSVKGVEYSGWQEVHVSKSMNSLSNSFSLAITDKYDGKLSLWDFREGDLCEVKVDGKQVIKGYIEDMDIDHDYNSHSIVIAGRGVTCDLVDCSFYDDSTTWNNTQLRTIVQHIADKQGVSVVIDSDVLSDASTIIPKYTAESTDTLLDLIVELCLHKAILPVGYGDGKLTLTRSGCKGECKDSLELGYNILKGGLRMSDRDRFSHYKVVGQGSASENKSLFSTVAASGTATDEVVSRTRKLAIGSDKVVDSGECIKFANWEATNRAGKSRSYIFEVQGWCQSIRFGGAVWDLNTLVKVNDSKLGVKDTLLISDLSFSKNLSEGTKTTIGVVHPDTYKSVEKPIKNIRTGWDGT